MTTKAIKKIPVGELRKMKVFFIVKGATTPIAITSFFEMNVT